MNKTNFVSIYLHSIYLHFNEVLKMPRLTKLLQQMIEIRLPTPSYPIPPAAPAISELF